MKSPLPEDINSLQQNFDDFFEMGLCGFILANKQGYILRANERVSLWRNQTKEELKGSQFVDLLSIGSKIYYETHLRPLLRMQGFFDEVVLEISNITGGKLQVMVNAFERRDDNGDPLFIRYTILKASDRLLYENNLKQAKTKAEDELEKQREMVVLREQFIAVLGHDLRNPLSAIGMATDLFHFSPDSDNNTLLTIIKRSSTRMAELVANIMDFARTRLGGGIVLNWQPTMLEPILESVIAEMRIIHPAQEIISEFNIHKPVNCDSDRLAQLLSNLLSNGITHGDTHFPVIVRAILTREQLEIEVSNKGISIPHDLHDRLFAPFTREGNRASENGLGLGLYICSEIAKAHNGSLSFTSSEQGTTFTFSMKL